MGRLFWKVFLGFWVTLVLAGVGVGAGVLLYSQERREDDSSRLARQSLPWQMNALATALQHEGLPAVRQLLEQNEASYGRFVLIVDAEGRDLLGRPVPMDLLMRHQQGMREHHRDSRAVGPERGSGPSRLRGQQVRAPDGQAYLLMPLPIAARRPPRFPWELQLLVAVLASVAFSAGLAWYLTRPVRHLRAASRRLAEGALETRVAAQMGHRRDEIADLGRDFDYMAERLQSLVDAQRRLLHDVSHELRSPMARMQTAIGLMRQQPGKADAMTARIEQEIHRLDALVGEVLTLSRLEAAGVTAPGGEVDYVDLGELLRVIGEDAEFEAQARGGSVQLHTLPGVVVRGQAELLRRALDNLMRNALLHGQDAAQVEVAMQFESSAPSGHTGQWVRVEVRDRGPGVTEAALETLFEPFIAGKPSASRGGAGLGLAIARRAVLFHGGSISAHNRPGGGLCVVVMLPCTESSEED